jgi:TP901 family phage tail tape measure protein
MPGVGYREAIILVRTIDMSTKTMGGIAGTFAQMGAKMEQTGLALSAALTAPIIALGAASAKVATDFDKNMRNIQSISKESDVQIRALGQRFLELSTNLQKTTATPSELAKGFYEIQSASIYGADAQKILETSTKLATATLADQTDTAKALSMVFNAYGRDISQVPRYADAMARAVDIGVFHMTDLNQQMGDFLNTAALLKVPLEDALAVITTLTKKSMTPDLAATSLNRLMVQFLKPSPKSAQAALELGVPMNAAAIQTMGLANVLKLVGKQIGLNTVITAAEKDARVQDIQNLITQQENEIRYAASKKQSTAGLKDELAVLKQRKSEIKGQIFDQLDYNSTVEDMAKSTGKSADAIARLFPDMRGLRGVIGLLDDDLQMYLGDQATLYKSAGMVATTYAIQTKSFDAQMQSFKNTVSASAIALGTELMPVLIGLAQHIKPLIEQFTGLDASTKRTFIGIGLGLAAIGPALFIAGMGLQALGGILGSLWTMVLIPFKMAEAILSIGGRVALGIKTGMAAPVLLLGVIIVGVALVWINNWGGMRDAVINMWNAAEPSVDAIIIKMGSLVPAALAETHDAFVTMGVGIAAVFNRISDVINFAKGKESTYSPYEQAKQNIKDYQSMLSERNQEHYAPLLAYAQLGVARVEAEMNHYRDLMKSAQANGGGAGLVSQEIWQLKSNLQQELGPKGFRELEESIKSNNPATAITNSVTAATPSAIDAGKKLALGFTDSMLAQLQAQYPAVAAFINRYLNLSTRPMLSRLDQQAQGVDITGTMSGDMPAWAAKWEKDSDAAMQKFIDGQKTANDSLDVMPQYFDSSVQNAATTLASEIGNNIKSAIQAAIGLSGTNSSTNPLGVLPGENGPFERLFRVGDIAENLGKADYKEWTDNKGVKHTAKESQKWSAMEGLDQSAAQGIWAQFKTGNLTAPGVFERIDWNKLATISAQSIQNEKMQQYAGQAAANLFQAGGGKPFTPEQLMAEIDKLAKTGMANPVVGAVNQTTTAVNDVKTAVDNVKDAIVATFTTTKAGKLGNLAGVSVSAEEALGQSPGNVMRKHLVNANSATAKQGDNKPFWGLPSYGPFSSLQGYGQQTPKIRQANPPTNLAVSNLSPMRQANQNVDPTIGAIDKTTKAVTDVQTAFIKQLVDSSADMVSKNTTAIETSTTSINTTAMDAARLIVSAVIGKFFSGLTSSSSSGTTSASYGPTGRKGGYARGTTFAPGGWSMVGEYGPEMVRLPWGSQVFNSQRTQGMMGQTSGDSMSSVVGGLHKRSTDDKAANDFIDLLISHASIAMQKQMFDTLQRRRT